VSSSSTGPIASPFGPLDSIIDANEDTALIREKGDQLVRVAASLPVLHSSSPRSSRTNKRPSNYAPAGMTTVVFVRVATSWMSTNTW
jgi:hypothetical protein